MATVTETKKAVRTFWGNRPCGVDDSDEPPQSRAFFAETEAKRFQIHVDWDRPFLQDAIGYSKYTGKKMLEIGCGVGVDSILWHRAGNQVVSLDYNFPSVEITKARFAAEDVKSRCLNGDAESLPFADETFDLIYSFGVLHHTPDTQKTIDEVYRCLRPGGEAIIMLYYKWSALILGETLLGHGLRGGKLFKTGSVGKLISEYTEFQSQYEGNVNPLTKVYSKREVRKMFHRFQDVKLELHYLWPGNFGPLRRLVLLFPKSVKKNLHRVLGWNVVIKASKPL
jgi:ubiquinone/menaquinone biosynthesis C-methylase UbiE